MKRFILILTLFLSNSCIHTMTVEEFLEETNVKAFCRKKIKRKTKYLMKECIKKKYSRYFNKKEREKASVKAFAIGSILGLGLATIVLSDSYIKSNYGNGNFRKPANSTFSGKCDYEWQYDSAGRRCGGRAASVRPGGRLGGSGQYTDSYGRSRLYGKDNDPYDESYKQSLITNTYNNQETIEQVRQDIERRHKERMCLQQSINYKKCKILCNSKSLISCNCFSLKPDFECPIKFHY